MINLIVKQPCYDGPVVARTQATDFDKQWEEKDPVLFPTEAKDEILKKFPPTIVVTAEFDRYLQANREFRERLRKNGKLLDSVEYPGSDHAFFYNLSYKYSSCFFADLMLMINSYAKGYPAPKPLVSQNKFANKYKLTDTWCPDVKEVHD
jgi:acetyl esterase/lipase